MSSIRSNLLVHPRWVGSSVLILLVLQLVQYHRGPVGREPHLQSIRIANTANPVSESGARSSWFQFLGRPRVWRYGPSHCFFFSCIAGRVRDMVGQLLEIRLELKANWMQKFPWKRTKNNKKTKPQNTPQQAPNNNTTAREIRKTK